MDELSVQTTTGFERWIVSLVGIAVLAAILIPALARFSPWIGLVLLAGLLPVIPYLARRLPPGLQGGLRRRTFLSLAWFLLAVIAIIQVSRLSAFMADPSRTWGSTVPDPMAIKHQCMSAYIYAADLARRGEKNIYDEKFYPAFSRKPGSPQKKIESHVTGLGEVIEDPYQYPPPFLILPTTALALSNHFPTIRTGWFILQALVLVICGILFARWIGGKEGLLVGLLLPALLASLPLMFNLQFGQFHAVTLVLAIAAMVAFEKQKIRLGGALLSFAMLAKIFPGILLIYLLSQRRWREIAWTLGFGCFFTLLGIAIVGFAPFQAFISYELPRLANGEAFSFIEKDGVPTFIVARNYSITGIVTKLRLLGFEGITSSVATILAWLFTIMIVCLAWLAGKISSEKQARLSRALIWLALLNLAAMRTPLLPSAYGMAPFLLLLCLLAAEVKGRLSHGVALVVMWLLIMGVAPLPDRAEIVFDLVSEIVTIARNLFVLLRRPLQVPALPLERTRPEVATNG